MQKLKVLDSNPNIAMQKHWWRTNGNFSTTGQSRVWVSQLDKGEFSGTAVVSRLLLPTKAPHRGLPSTVRVLHDLSTAATPWYIFFHWLHDVWATIVAENTRQLQHFQVNHSPSSNYLEKCFPSSCSMACAWFAVSIKKCKFQEVDICICLQKLRNWTAYLQLSCEACAYRNIVPHCWNEPKHWIAEESRQKHHPQLQSFFNYFHFRRDVTTKYYCASRHQGWLTSLH